MSEDIMSMDFGEFMPVEDDALEGITHQVDDTVTSIKEENLVSNDPLVEEHDTDINEILSNIEEEPEEQQEKETEKDPAPKDIKESSSEPFTLVFAKFMKEQGLLSDFDEEALNEVVSKNGDAEALSYLMSGELEVGRKSIKTEYDDYSQEYIKLREAGVNSEDAKTAVFDLEKISTITEADLEDEDNSSLRKQVLKELYKSTTKFSDDRIDKLINRSADLGDDVEESKSALEDLKEIKKENLAKMAADKATEQQDRAREYQESIKTLKAKIDEKDAIIPNHKINKQTKDKLNDMLTKPAKTLDSGQVLNAVWAKRHDSPMEFDITLAYLVNAGVFDGNFKGLVTGAKTRATEELEKAIKNDSTFSKGSYRSTIQTDKKEQDMIQQMKSIFK